MKYKLSLAAIFLILTSSSWGETTLEGDHRIGSSANPAEPGDLTVEGSAHILSEIDYGSTNETNPQSGVALLYSEPEPAGSLFNATFSATRDGASFIWEQNGGGTAKAKMTLDGTNKLQLWNAAGSSANLTLNGATGTISLKGPNSGTVDLSVDSNGKLVHSGPVVFNQGVTIQGDVSLPSTSALSIGTASLTSGNLSFMQQAVHNLGFRSTSAVPPADASISLPGMAITALTKDAAGNIYIAGSGAGILGTTQVRRIFVAKLNQSGAFSWVRTESDYNVADIAVDGSGNVYVSDDAGVRKLNADGQEQWRCPVSLPGTIALDGSGNSYLAAAFSHTISTGLPQPLQSAGWSDVALLKINSAGAVVWGKKFGGIGYESSHSIAADNNGNVYLIGPFDGTMDTGLLQSSPLTETGGGSAFVVAVYSSGSLMWANHVGGTGSTVWPSGLSRDDSGNLYLAGSFSGTLDTGILQANPLAGSGSGSNYDGFVLSLNSSGALNWRTKIEATGAPGSVYANDIAANGTGGAYVVGTRVTTDNDASAFTEKVNANGMIVGGGNARSVGYSDMYLAATSNDGTLAVAGYSDGGAWIGNQLVKGCFLYLGTENSLAYDCQKVASPLAWGSSIATSVGSVALGSAASASAVGSVALGQGTVTSGANYAFAAGQFSEASATGAMALGSQAAASGHESTALGSGKARGVYSTAIGSGTAEGNDSIAMGSGTAEGEASIAIGPGTAEGDASIAIGPGTASGYYSLAIGSGRAVGHNSTAIGFGTAQGNHSTATGLGTAKGQYSTALGGGTAEGNFSTTIGEGHAMGSSSLAIGRYNVLQGNPTSWVATDDLLVGGNGTAYTARSNAFSIKKNGNTWLAGNIEAVGTNNLLPNQTLTGATSILTRGLADARYVQPSALNSYLTTSAAGTTYLTQTSATSTYLSQSTATATYLTQTAASSTYLTQTAASNTYLTQAAGDALFLTPAEGNDSYIGSSQLPGLLTEAEAAVTYLSQANANSTYQPKAGPLAIGSSVAVTGLNSSAVGSNLSVPGYQQFVIGRYHDNAGSTTAWEPSDPLFVIGNGSSVLPGNAFVIAKNGNLSGTGASNTLPNQTLVDDGSILTRGLADDRYVTQDGPESYLTQGEADLRYYQQTPELLVLNSNGVTDPAAALSVGIGGTGTPSNTFTISKAGNLTAQGSGSFGGTFSVTGAIAANDDLTVGGELVVAGSVRIGASNINTGTGSMAVGSNLNITGAHQVVLGRFNDPSGNPSDWVPEDDLFVIGNGTADGSRSNALVVKKNGDTKFQANVEVEGTLRVEERGDLSMGQFQ